MKKLYSFLLEDSESGEIYYLGYPLNLTPSEKAVLKILSDNTDRYLLPSNIEALSVGEHPLKSTSISVHISSINSKAFSIGERHIIESKRTKGYKLYSNL